MTRALIILAVAAIALSACGKRGELQPPGPHWDEPTHAAPAR